MIPQSAIRNPQSDQEGRSGPASPAGNASGLTPRPTCLWIAGLTILGVGIRLVFLLLAGDLEPYADESNYLYLALLWNRFGVYSDCALYLWPPGYPLFLAFFLRVFGVGGIFAAKLCQVLLSGVIGCVVMLLGRRLFSARAAMIAGAIWCVYLPLIGFSHYLWPETLYLAVFLPGFYLLVTWWQRSDGSAGGNGRLVAAGVLVGVSLLIKEVGLWWCVVVCGLILWRDRRSSFGLAVSRSALFALSVGVVILPWTLRNYEVYGRFVPVGATLGQNLYYGLNSRYLNLDYPPGELYGRVTGANAAVCRALVAPEAPGWERSATANIVDRSSEDVRRGLEYGWEHPGFALRTRVKKLADWATPLSFFMRHYALGRYHGFLAGTGVRRVLLAGAVALPILVLGGAVPGFFRYLRGGSVRMLLGWTLAYFIAATALVNGASRYRACVEPLLIALAGGFLDGAGRPWSGDGQRSGCVAAWAGLAMLWCVNAAEVIAFFRSVW